MTAGKRAIVSLVERNNAGSRVRSFYVAVADGETVGRIANENIAEEAHLMTGESRFYTAPGWGLASHHIVVRSKGEYARAKVHTKTVEGYFSIFKRGMRGNYQHCKEKNLHRYLAEFDFRYDTRNNTDGERAALTVKGSEGKRLTCLQPH